MPKFICITRWLSDTSDEIEYSYTAPTAKELSRRPVRRGVIQIANSARVYFINLEEATNKGFRPRLDQASNFDFVAHTPGDAILQPSHSPEDSFDENRVVVKSARMFVSIPKESLKRIPALGSGVDVRMSRIKDAGRGVYATRVFAQNEIITLYCGHIFGEVHRKWMQTEGLGTHSKPLTQKLAYLDGVKTVFKGMHVGQLVNHSDSLANSSFVTVDLLPYTGERVIALKATRMIHRGEEIYVQYGSKFWAEQRADPDDAPDIIIPKPEFKRARTNV